MVQAEHSQQADERAVIPEEEQITDSFTTCQVSFFFLKVHIPFSPCQALYNFAELVRI